MMDIFRYPTPEGFDDLLMCTDGEVLTGLWFEGSREGDKQSSEIVETQNFASLQFEIPPVIRDTCHWLDVYFSGRQPDFTPAYRMQSLTSFRKAVLDFVCEIPFGQTMTYGGIARRIEEMFRTTSPQPRKMSAQAVGGAVGWNPICLIVPCHRVVGANGNLIGYGGGLHNKIALLRLEGCSELCNFAPNNQTQTKHVTKRNSSPLL